jgi:glycosyltransferase involved in cell wall biosynthesis
MKNPENLSKRILFVSTMASVSWGGSEELWSQTALALRLEGYDIHCIVYDWSVNHKAISLLGKYGVIIHSIAHEKKWIARQFSKTVNLIHGGKYQEWETGILKMIRPDLVVISQGYIYDGLRWCHSCKKSKINYCVIVHSNSHHWWPEDHQLYEMRKCYLEAVRCFFVSKSNKEMLERQLGVSLNRSDVVVNPWSPTIDGYVPWPDKVSKFDIACVARLDPRAKGQDLLIEILSMPQWRDRELYINFYGDGPCRLGLEAMSRHLHVSKIRFMGYSQSIREIWSHNQLLVLPSRFEGLPIVIVEAMLSGRPVVTTDVAGNLSYLDDNISGFVAHSPTVDCLNEAMNRAWSRRNEWREMGITARRNIVKALPSYPISRFCEQVARLVIA